MSDEGLAPFNVSFARNALLLVGYKDCGRGGQGRVSVVFGSKGLVVRAEVLEGAYAPATTACIEASFRKARIPAFTGPTEPQVLDIALPLGAPTPAPLSAEAPLATHASIPAATPRKRRLSFTLVATVGLGASHASALLGSTSNPGAAGMLSGGLHLLAGPPPFGGLFIIEARSQLATLGVGIAHVRVRPSYELDMGLSAGVHQYSDVGGIGSTRG